MRRRSAAGATNGRSPAGSGPDVNGLNASITLACLAALVMSSIWPLGHQLPVEQPLDHVRITASRPTVEFGRDHRGIPVVQKALRLSSRTMAAMADTSSGTRSVKRVAASAT